MDLCFLYFIIQGLGSFLFLSCFYGRSLCRPSGNIEVVIDLSLSLKISLFPFHFWIFKILEVANMFQFWILIGIQKLPILFLLYTLFNDFLYLIMIIRMRIGSFLMVKCLSLSFLLASSSIYRVFWGLFIFLSSCERFVAYYFMYVFFLYVILSYQGDTIRSIYFVSFLFFIGLPPLRLFFFKLLISFWGVWILTPLEWLIFWIRGFLAIVGYFTIFFKDFFFKNFLYLKHKKQINLICLFQSVFLLFSFFLI